MLMLPYLMCFSISSFLLFITERIKESKWKKLLIFFALIIPCLLSAFRDLSIGTDVLVYLNPMSNAAQSSNNFIDYLSMSVSGNRFVYKYEIGFTLLVYILSNLFRNIHVLMFFIQILIIFPVYFGCMKIRYLKDKSWLCMFIYYWCFY